MKLFRIPKWDEKDTGLKHYATTWQIAKDKDFQKIVIESKEDTKNITAWKVNIEVPAGSVYWIRAKRHLKDSDGNVVAYDKWIGPDSFMDENTSQNEILVSSTYIEEPFIISHTIDKDGLTIELEEPKGNVPNIRTNWVIEDEEGNEIFSSIEDKNNITKLQVSNDVYNFTAAEYVVVKINHVGDLGTQSPTITEYLSYSNELYKVKNIVDMDPNIKNTIVIESNNENGVEVLSAIIEEMDGTVAYQPDPEL